MKMGYDNINEIFEIIYNAKSHYRNHMSQYDHGVDLTYLRIVKYLAR